MPETRVKHDPYPAAPAAGLRCACRAQEAFPLGCFEFSGHCHGLMALYRATAALRPFPRLRRLHRCCCCQKVRPCLCPDACHIGREWVGTGLKRSSPGSAKVRPIRVNQRRRGGCRLGTSVCRVTRDQKGAGSYCVRQGMRLVPTELWVRRQRILLSGTWGRADSERTSLPLPHTSGMSGGLLRDMWLSDAGGGSITKHGSYHGPRSGGQSGKLLAPKGYRHQQHRPWHDQRRL